MTHSSPHALLKKLEQAGLPAQFVETLLPDWLSASALEAPELGAETKLALARRFDLDVQALFSESEDVVYRAAAHARYKRSLKAYQADLNVATSLAVSQARLAATATPIQFHSPPNNASDLRKAIFERFHGLKYLSFPALLKFCWETGIPVIFLATLPEKLARMDALAMLHEGRPVIVIAKNAKYSAWMSFILAHELAHIALGHLQPDELLVDESISDTSYLFADAADLEEVAADKFAIELLNGRPGAEYKAARPLNPNELIAAAMREQKGRGVDAGHVILNYGHTSGEWGVAMAALSRIDHSDARLLLWDALRSQIDAERLSPDSYEFLLKTSHSAH